MKMIKWVLSFSLLLSLQNNTYSQKVLSEGTIVYDITVQTGSKEPQLADMFDGVTTTIYLKGGQSRSEMISPLGSTISIQDARTGSGVILKEYGNQKLLIQMSRADWADMNKKYAGITFTKADEFKTIAGHKCQKAVAKLKDGSSFIVYFTTELMTENKDYDFQFKTLPGLALEYESSVGNLKVKYSASKISFDPVPVQKFAIPLSGYRQLTYEESKNLKSSN
ncbi:MAG: hypothetical protein KF862_15155 [Chitinophagaceae bacterium]|nr:hypothetical protein [Chitinophagaceae bacterium]